MAKQVGCDADLLGGAVDKLGHGAVAEEMGPDMPAEGVPSAGLDLLPDRRTAHRPTVPIEPQMTAETGQVHLAGCN